MPTCSPGTAHSWLFVDGRQTQERLITMGPEAQWPLPARQYRRYIVFWSFWMVASVVGALAVVIYHAYTTGYTWRHGLVALLLVVQLALFSVMLRYRFPAESERLLIGYFVANFILCALEFWLLPVTGWLVFAYLGQMYGMLSPRPALILTGGVTALALALGGWPLWRSQPRLFWGAAAQWLAIVTFMVYVNHLIQTSRERGRLIAKLEAAQRELAAAQQREAELAVLRERERLARDLHDSLGHTLVALSVQLEAVQRLYRVDPVQASAQVDELKALVRASMEALRRSLAGLRTPGLGERALRPALQALCVEFGERTGLTVTCQVDAAADTLGPALAETLWRVVQEALTNVEKHAQARQVTVELTCASPAAQLRVTDDGIGLPPGAESAPNRFGLRGMRERVEGVGGTFTVRSNERGTTVEVVVPLISGREVADEAR
jgi:signal transduction histidine kinase